MWLPPRVDRLERPARRGRHLPQRGRAEGARISCTTPDILAPDILEPEEEGCWGKWPRLVFPWQLAPQGQA